jgi:GH43 family beta-xylosidase
MIEKGMPGAGNILMFDNGTDRKESILGGDPEPAKMTVILEINPATKQIVWLYQDGRDFYSAIQGTQQRLPNGNTFICESTTGRIFEVTRDGEVVWEYVMPPFPGSDEEHGFGTRPHRYPYDYCPQLKKGKDTFTNPLKESGADPWIFYHEGFYYYTNTLSRRIGIWRTKDITELKNAEYKTIYVPPENTMYSKQLWAPEIMNINDNWYVYFAADDGDNLNHKLYVLENTSDDPFEGEFKMKGKIKTDKDDNWAIDGSVFYHKGDYYFIWSGWQTSPYVDVETQCIYIARMENPWTLATDRVLISKPEYEWERIWKNPDEWNNTNDHITYVNEGPEVLAHDDKLFLVYSASGCWTPFYALGMLTADADSDLLNPKSWKKHPEPVFHQSEENGVYGTGHNCFFKSPDGTEDWILYHANDKPEQGCGGNRSPRAQLIKWNDDGTPNFGTALSTSTHIKKPSGINF